MKITGDAAREYMEKGFDRAEREYAKQLEAAKAEAAKNGKEPFDLEKLEPLCDTSHEGRMAPRDERYAEFEWKYYVEYPDILTIEEFAVKVDELSKW